MLSLVRVYERTPHPNFIILICNHSIPAAQYSSNIKAITPSTIQSPPIEMIQISNPRANNPQKISAGQFTLSFLNNCCSRYFIMLKKRRRFNFLNCLLEALAPAFNNNSVIKKEASLFWTGLGIVSVVLV